jgi:hypothetical protein
MKDMKARIEKLRDQAAECAIKSAEATTKQKRDFFAKLHDHLTDLADRPMSPSQRRTSKATPVGGTACTFGPNLNQ